MLRILRLTVDSDRCSAKVISTTDRALTRRSNTARSSSVKLQTARKYSHSGSVNSVLRFRKTTLSSGKNEQEDHSPLDGGGGPQGLDFVFLPPDDLRGERLHSNGFTPLHIVREAPESRRRAGRTAPLSPAKRQAPARDPLRFPLAALLPADPLAPAG